MDFRHPLKVITPTLDGDVLTVLGRAEQELSGREVHRLVGHSSEQGVRRTLNRLAEQGIVLRRAAGRANLYSLNREHLAAPSVERLAVLRLELIRRLREAIAAWAVAPLAAVLFGSVARGEAGPDSDLDLLVVRRSEHDADDPEWSGQLMELQRAVTAWTGNRARVLELAADEVSAADRVVGDALAEGIAIGGAESELRGLADPGRE
jgi:predicted nucleotidyltransferase